MTIFEKKDKLQQKCLNLWIKNNYKGSFFLATGVGKTRLGMLAALMFKKVLIVGPTIRIKDERWKEEFVKWNCVEHYNNYIQTVTYVSLNKLNEQFDLIIFDEGHHITPSNFEYFKNSNVNLKNTAIMLLTATPPIDETKKQLIKSIAPKLMHYSLENAIFDGIAAPFNFNIIEIPLSTENNFKVEFKTKSWITSEEKRHQSLNNTVNGLMFSGKTKALQFAILNRKRFLDTLPSKLNYIKKLQTKLKNKRTLFFVGSINECEQLNIPSHH